MVFLVLFNRGGNLSLINPELRLDWESKISPMYIRLGLVLPLSWSGQVTRIDYFKFVLSLQFEFKPLG